MEDLNGSILIVDDNAVIRQIMKLALEHNHHQITQAKDGLEAIDLMQAHIFDLILLDIMMPNMDGFAVLEYMAQVPELAKIPVIVVSIDSQIDSAIRCIQLGAEDYLVKPPNQTLLRARVNSSLRKKRLNDQEQSRQAEMEQLYAAVNSAHQAKTEFIAMAAHELRNPIAQIAMTNSLLKQVGYLNEKQEQLIEKVNFSLERMQALIVDLDDISRMETGNIQIKFVPLDLQKLIMKIVDSLDHDLEMAKHTIVLQFSDDLPLVLADGERMIQILINLVGNAIKYTPDGGEITISAECSTSGQMVQVTIQDTGLGIDSEEQAHIFDRFFRSGDSDVRSRPGTGLGLYITKSLIEKHNGRIWFESNYGKGTVFHFTLPSAATTEQEGTEMETAVNS
ncbi:MAG: hybrid sensor histidine kinase/response regulator [Chloroflexi bacterium]|nr:hybrid sensor histidine kinase/response regulator [Chloroflexota bacterium]